MNISAALGLSSDFRSDVAGEAFSVEVRRWCTGSTCKVVRRPNARALGALMLLEIWVHDSGS